METSYNPDTNQTAVLDPKVNRWFIVDDVAKNDGGGKAYLYNNEWHLDEPEPEPKEMPSTVNVLGLNKQVFDVAINTLSSLGGFISGGVAGAGSAVAGLFTRDSIEENLQQANITQEKVQKFITDLPEIITGKELTPEAQEVMGVLGWPFEKLHEGSGWLGEKADKLTGIPYIEPTVATIAEAIPLIFGPKFLKEKLIDVPVGKGKTALSAKAIEKTIPAEKTTPIKAGTPEVKAPVPIAQPGKPKSADELKGAELEGEIKQLEPQKENLASLSQEELKLTKETGAIGLKPSERPTFTGKAKEVDEMYNRADKALKDLNKKSFSKIYKKLKTEWVDVSGNLKNELLKKGDAGKEVVMRHDLIAGSPAKALQEYDIASHKIFNGLDTTEHNYLDRIIQSRRTIAIEEYKNIKHPEGLGKEAHQDFINQLPKETWNKLNERANFYFNEMKNQLTQLKNEKILSQEQYDNLVSKGAYSPRQFIQFLDPETTYTVGGKKITVPDSGIKSLDEGSYGLLEKDSSKLLAQVITRTQARIFKNKANKSLYRLAQEIPDNGVVKLAKVTKTTEDGKPVYQTAPHGYDKIKVMIDGQAKEMLMPTEMAQEWIVRDPILMTSQATFLKWASGSAILKPMATGLNPEFALTNIPRDLAHIWITDYNSIYSKHLPVYTAQMFTDLATVAKDAVTRKGRYTDYTSEGGGMDFLTHQGRITNQLQGFWNDLQKVFGWVGETSEIVTRLALRERGIKAGLKPEEATYRARNYLDFSQGGSMAKAADTMIPYLNASIQGTRGIFQSATRNPAVFSYKVAQIGTLATSLYFMNKVMNQEALDQVSSVDKRNNWIITTPFQFQDKDNNKRFVVIKIAKDQGQRLFASIFEAIAQKSIGDDIDVDQITSSVGDFIPILPQSMIPPTMDAIIGYAANKDFWRNEDIWKGGKVAPQEEYRLNKYPYTHPLFVQAGSLTGLSPERLEYSLQQYFTYGNIWTSLGGYAYKQIFQDMSDADKNKTTKEIILEQPFIRRMVSRTDPSYKDKKKYDDLILKQNTEKWIRSRDFDDLSQKYYDGEATIDEIKRYIHDVPLVERKNLKRRFDNLGRMQKIPERRFWLNLADVSPETRAYIYWNKWRTASPEDRKKLDSLARQVPGVMSERFLKQLNTLKSKKEEPEED